MGSRWARFSRCVSFNTLYTLMCADPAEQKMAENSVVLPNHPQRFGHWIIRLIFLMFVCIFYRTILSSICCCSLYYLLFIYSWGFDALRWIDTVWYGVCILDAGSVYWVLSVLLACSPSVHVGFLSARHQHTHIHGPNVDGWFICFITFRSYIKIRLFIIFGSFLELKELKVTDQLCRVAFLRDYK